MPTASRILGPSHNRLLIVATRPQDGPTPAGLILPEVADQLIRAGWKQYDGPATARRGWIVEGTDPSLRPRAHTPQ